MKVSDPALLGKITIKMKVSGLARSWIKIDPGLSGKITIKMKLSGLAQS
jgi:hypothetical protein